MNVTVEQNFDTHLLGHFGINKATLLDKFWTKVLQVQLPLSFDENRNNKYHSRLEYFDNMGNPITRDDVFNKSHTATVRYTLQQV